MVATVTSSDFPSSRSTFGSLQEQGRSSIESILEQVSPETVRVFYLVNYGVLLEIICLFGVISNVINGVVFVKQGFKDTVNISLLGLAVADGLALTVLFWLSLNFNPLVPSLLLQWQGVLYLSSSLPNIIAIRVTCLITVFITFERFLCVSIPLKIKSIITHRRTVFIVVILFLFSILTVIPVYIACYIGPVFDYSKNVSTLGLHYIPGGQTVENATISFGLGVQFLAFGLTFVLTVLLVRALQSQSRWRDVTTSVPKANQLTNRDKAIGKMIILISTVFIVCYTPFVVGSVAMVCFQEFKVTGRFRNVYNIVWSVIFTVDSLHSALSIFVYLKTSTKYRTTFCSIFRWQVLVEKK